MKREPYDVIDLKALRCFLAVARRGSLTKAGIELGISESAVSQRVKSLEAYLRVGLYEARGGKVQLTPAGERVASLAISAFGELESLEQAAAGASEIGELTLASHDSVLRYLLPTRIDAFYRAFPLAQLRLIARPVDATIRLVRSNECDLGVIPETVVPDELVFKAVATYPTCLILPKGHPLARRARTDFPSLMADGSVGRYPLILLEVQREDGRIQRAFEQFNIPFKVSLEVSTIDTLKYYVARGRGGALLPAFALTGDDHARLEVLEIPAAFGAGTTYGVISRRDKRRDTLLGKLLELLGTFDRA